nr:MAG TPA: helix-turn-helix XRE-family like protein [Caudoviricetes sp.]
MRIKEMRQRKGLTQSDLAKAVGVKQPSVVSWENGSHLPSPRRTGALLKVLDCTFEELFEEEDFKRAKRR